MIVRRSNGEIVELKVSAVDRRKRLVVIDIVEYKSRFIFSDATGSIALTDDGRKVLDNTKPAITHVSKSVYTAMAGWAGAILNDKRRKNIERK